MAHTHTRISPAFCSTRIILLVERREKTKIVFHIFLPFSLYSSNTPKKDALFARTSSSSSSRLEVEAAAQKTVVSVGCYRWWSAVKRKQSANKTKLTLSRTTLFCSSRGFELFHKAKVNFTHKLTDPLTKHTLARAHCLINWRALVADGWKVQEQMWLKVGASWIDASLVSSITTHTSWWRWLMMRHKQQQQHWRLLFVYYLYVCVCVFTRAIAACVKRTNSWAKSESVSGK